MRMSGFKGLSQQKGATLIVVLFILVLITIVGVVAVRVAMTSLNIATNSQIGQLLFQTGDSPLNQMLNATDLRNIGDISGAVGAAIKENETAPGKEFVFCYKPTSSRQLGVFIETTVLVPPAANADPDTKATLDSSRTNRKGFCNLKTDFGSKRQAVVTQVAVTIPVDSADDVPVCAYCERGTDKSLQSASSNKVSQQRIRFTATSFLPAYANTDLDTVQNDCIGSSTTVGYINDNLDSAVAGKVTVADCLAKYGIPVNTQIQEVNLTDINVQTNQL